MITAILCGASGYSGAELLRLLERRSDVTCTHLFGGSSAGRRVRDLYPSLVRTADTMYEAFDPVLADGADVAFLALPSGEAMHIVPTLAGSVGRIIDLGGDFRLPSPSVYREYYHRDHAAVSFLPGSVYGLPELNREKIERASLIANPGCYPTGAILGLLPALESGLVSTNGIVVNALSGVSGAGRSASVDLSFTEVNENVRAYKIGRHQHIPEIQHVLEQATGKPLRLSFVPHLIPITRGIYTTIHAPLTRECTTEDAIALYREYYSDAPFVRVRPDVPQIAHVVRTNFCDIGPVVEQRTGQLIVVTAIDNLIKGAAGQALQNMNIMMHCPETTGLKEGG